MKKKIVLILFLLIGAIGYSQEVPAPVQVLDCSKFKNFKAYNPDYPKKTFIVKGATQESYDNGVLQLEWSVNWLSGCEYEVTCTKVNGESPMVLGDKIVMTFVSIDDDCFTLKRTFFCKNFPKGDIDDGSTYCLAK